MGKSVELIVHDVPSCGSSRLQVFQQDDGSYDGYCYGCGKVVENPYKDYDASYKPTRNGKSDEEIQEELSAIAECGSQSIPDRKLGKVVMEKYGVKVGMSEIDGVTPNSYHFPYTSKRDIKAYKNLLIKRKANGKKVMWTTGVVKDTDLFGWEVAANSGSPRLYITEGEFDALALNQMIVRQQKGTSYEGNEPAVVSIRTGAGNADKELASHLEKFKRFKEVVLVFDNDDEGQAAVERVLRIAPHFLSAKLPRKDANQCMIDGLEKAAVAAVKWQAGRPKNTRLVWGSDVHEDAKKPAEWGASYPFPELTERTRGMRGGETVYIGAGVKMGKSELLNALASHCITEHGWKVFLAKPEEALAKTYKMMASKVASAVFHDPKVEFDEQAYEKAGEVLADKLCMLDLYQEIRWEDLAMDIKAAAAAGCKAVFIDPITNLTDHLSPAEANTELQTIAQQASILAKDLDIIVFLFCHCKAPDGDPHERGGKVKSTQFAGSRAMMRKCNYMFGLEGNKDPELSEKEKRRRLLCILEDREFGESAEIPLMWNPVTTQYTQVG